MSNESQSKQAKLPVGYTQHPKAQKAAEGKCLRLKAGFMDVALGKPDAAGIKKVQEHQFNKPLDTMFGGKPKDLFDYYGAANPKKKNFNGEAVPFEDLLVATAASLMIKTDPVLGYDVWSIDQAQVAKELGRTPEGALFTADDIKAVSLKTAEHYGIVSVATSFDVAMRLINCFHVIETLGWFDMLPPGTKNVWWLSVLVIMWALYEGKALGGLCDEALLFHRDVRTFIYSGKLGEDPCPYDTLFTKWKELIKDEGMLESIWSNQMIFDLFMFGAHLRAIAGAVDKWVPEEDLTVNKNLQEYSFGDLGWGELSFLASITQVMRSTAKDRMNLEGEGDTAGCLLYLVGNTQDEDLGGDWSGSQFQEVLVALQEAANNNPKISVALLQLMGVTGRFEGMIATQTKFVRRRKAIINEES